MMGDGFNAGKINELGVARLKSRWVATVAEQKLRRHADNVHHSVMQRLEFCPKGLRFRETGHTIGVVHPQAGFRKA